MASDKISSDEILLRRIPPDDIVPSTQPRPEGGRRATSARLKPRKDEFGVSCSRLLLTSPSELLDQLHHDNISPEGWMVCRIKVADIEQLGLKVVLDPTDRDPGHCEIQPGEKELTPAICSKLAKKTRILTEAEVTNLHSGESISE